MREWNFQVSVDGLNDVIEGADPNAFRQVESDTGESITQNGIASDGVNDVLSVNAEKIFDSLPSRNDIEQIFHSGQFSAYSNRASDTGCNPCDILV